MSNPRIKSAVIKSTASVQKAYSNPRAEITRPDEFASLSHYFLANWLPSITPNGLKILVSLRGMGYFQPKTGIQRGTIDIDQKVLAQQCGMGLRTLQRAFAEDVVLCKYVQRVFQIERDKFQRIVREHYVYVVMMDDVLTSEDEARLQLALEGPSKGAPEPMRQNGVWDEQPMRQNGVPECQNDAPTRQIGAPTRQNDASYKESLTLLTEDDTPNTLAAAPELSASLFEDKIKEQEQKETGPAGWTDLTPEQQEPFRAQAKHELLPYATQAGQKAWARMGPRQEEVRARNLYEAGRPF